MAGWGWTTTAAGAGGLGMIEMAEGLGTVAPHGNQALEVASRVLDGGSCLFQICKVHLGRWASRLEQADIFEAGCKL